MRNDKFIAKVIFHFKHFYCYTTKIKLKLKHRQLFGSYEIKKLNIKEARKIA